MEAVNAHVDILTFFKSNYYQLLEKIGEGGFGQVYKAKQLSTQQLVAIKFLSLPENVSEEKKYRYIERFHREVDLIRRLNHPNIVRLMDKGQQDELLYAVYEYIDGQSLRERLADSGSLEPSLAAEVMENVLDALAHAHEMGVIHRDIKPANIMLYQVGAKIHVKVLDFGIGTLRYEARQLDYKSITLTQETLGTPSYSAPEQLRGEPPIPQTDIYVWGLVFLECLTGKPAVSGSSLAAVFHQQLSQSNVPLGVLAGHESAGLLRRVLNKRASERPGDTLRLYQEFKKLNFSNLVGELNFGAKSQSDEIYDYDDSTQIVDARLSYTRLTERRQISVLSVIISIEQDDGVNHEEQDVLDALLIDKMQQCIDIAIRYGAYHVGNLGDTLLFYFGYPQVTENDSRLCARTALEVMSNIRQKNALLKQKQGLICYAQMGIQVGLMLSFANNQPQGKTANDAMKLSRKALPNQILCTENVKHLLDGYLHFEAGNSEIDDTHSSEPAFVLRGERQLEAFGFIRGTRKNPIFIGREAQLKMLTSLLSASRQNSVAPLAHIYGEAGIGKSRLVFELRNQCREFRHLVAQCLPEHKNNALYPILTLLKFKYSLDVVSAEKALFLLKEATKRTRLSEKQKEYGLVILSAWLNLPLPETNPAVNLTPEIQKQSLFDLIAHLLCQSFEFPQQGKAIAQHLFVFEDMHWADPTSLDFINHLLHSNVFMANGHCWLATSRETIPVQLETISFTQVLVPKLAKEETLAFIQFLFDQQPVATRLQETLLERTDGIPLFIEELASFMRNRNLVHKVNGEFDFVDGSKLALLPLTLRDSLQQKLDQLPYGKDTAQLAAAIGREFDYQLLTDASEKDEASVQRDLNALLSAELVYQQRKVDGDTYIFKHALVRDAAYDSIPELQKAIVHDQIVQSLKRLFSLNDPVEFVPDSFKKTVQESSGVVIPYGTLAKHCWKADNYKLAVNFSLFHISRNLLLSQYTVAQESCFYIKNMLPNDDSTKALLLNTEIMLSQTLVAQLGYSNVVVKDSYEQAMRLSSDSTHYKISTQISYGLFSFYASQGDFLSALSYAKALKEISIRYGDKQVELIAQMSFGLTLLLKGELDKAEENLHRAIELSDKLGTDSFLLEYGGNFGGYSRAWYALLQMLKGNNALALSSKSVAINKSQNHKQTLAFVKGFPFVEQFVSSLQQASEQAQQLIELSVSYQLHFFKLLGDFYLLWVKGVADLSSWDEEQSEQFLEQFEAAGLYSFLPRYYAMSAEISIRRSEVKQALQKIDKALSICKVQGHFYYAELYRLKAVAFHFQGASFTKVRRCLLAAKIISEQQGVVLWREKVAETGKQLEIELFANQRPYTGSNYSKG